MIKKVHYLSIIIIYFCQIIIVLKNILPRNNSIKPLLS